MVIIVVAHLLGVLRNAEKVPLPADASPAQRHRK